MKKSRTPNKGSLIDKGSISQINSFNAPEQMMWDINPGKNTSMIVNSKMIPNLDFTSDDTGESIRVCIRIRPLNMMELGRGDPKCLELLDNSTLLFKNK